MLMKFNVLVIDDEQLVCKSIKRILEDQEKQVFTALNYPEAEKILKQQSIDLVLLDYKLGDQDGLFVLKEIRDQYPDLSIIMITAHGNIDVAVEAMKYGAYDFIQKKEDPEFIRLSVERTLDNLRLKKEVEELKSSHIHNACLPRIITVSKAMQSTIDLAREFAKSDATVLVEGETGTGKNLIVEFVHYNSYRFNGQLVTINCSALPSELIESELFGYEEGAFTGARQKGKQGLIEQANGGTLFLDEISELVPDLQTKLLHVLEKNEFYRIGSVNPTKVDVRFIAATNANLEDMVNQKKFRMDLYYRLNIAAIQIQPLRSRNEDILPLTKFFIDEFNSKLNKSVTDISGDAKIYLKTASWPGNVRQLRNLIERTMLLKKDTLLRLEDIISPLIKSIHPPETSLFSINLNAENGENLLHKAEKQLILQALNISDGNVSRASQLLGIPRTTLNFYITRYKIKEES
jgi:DNA-binding NtrC family response regulator